MIMKKIFLTLLAIPLLAVSCKKDEDKQEKPKHPRDVQEVATENYVAIQQYLKTNFYNEASNEENFNGVIGLDTIAGINKNKTSLFEDSRLKKKIFKIKDAKGMDINHTFYYFIIKEGDGKQATVADSSLVNYKGQLLNGKVFDENKYITLNSWMDLLGDGSQNNGGTIKGFREGVSLLKDTKSDPSVNENGTFGSFEGFGKGIFFIPSALGYFNRNESSIPAYSPLIFTINLYKTKKADHDKDGIPSIEEIEIDDFGIITFKDCNKNRTPDYLDPKNCK